MSNKSFDWLKLLSEKRFSTNEVPSFGLSSFDHDYHEIISSPSFRRLQDKTQVFPLDRSDFIRTRLTHSLEVSALARTLANLVSQELYFRGLAPELSAARATEMADVLHAAALVHDIANPPFGHYGETSIRDWFQKNLPLLSFGKKKLRDILSEQELFDFINFEGNAQALRLLTKLHLNQESFGLDLSFAVLNTIIKYPCNSLEINKGSSNVAKHKMGYFKAEEDIFLQITSHTACYNSRHPLTFLLEAADDITYRTADIEDSYHKGKFSFLELLEFLKETKRLKDYDELCRDRYGVLVDKLEEFRQSTRLSMLQKHEQYAIASWLRLLRRELLADVADAFASNYSPIMQGNFQKSLFSGRLSGLLLDVLGDLAYDFVFSSRTIVQMEISANTIIGGLLDKFVPAALVWDSEEARSSLEPRLIDIISDNYKACYFREAKGLKEEARLYLRLLLVTDYISGMTDGFATDLYRKMHGQPLA